MHLTFYFINGSIWGPKLRDYIESSIIPLLPDFIMIIETKLCDSPSKKAQKWFHKRGYQVKFSAAAKGSGEGRKGGVLIAWLAHLHVDPLAPQEHTQHTDIQGGRGPDWALVLLRVKKANFLIGPIYLTSGQGFEQDNFTKLYQVRRCSSFYLAHLALFGDFNEEPKDWPPSLHQSLRTEPVAPQGTKGTCNMGQMRMLDYGIVHQPVASLFSPSSRLVFTYVSSFRSLGHLFRAAPHTNAPSYARSQGVPFYRSI